jgi:hypothetical protein
MIENIVILLLHVVHNSLVTYSHYLNAIDSHITNVGVRFYNVHHVGNLLQPFAKRVKLAKDVILAANIQQNTWCFNILNRNQTLMMILRVQARCT